MAGQLEDELSDSQKTAFDWCKEGNVDGLKRCVNHAFVNSRDDQVTVATFSGMSV